MFGFSLTKLLFTIAAVLVIWYGFKWVGRMNDQRAAEARRVRNADAGSPAARNPVSGDGETEDLVKCSACGDYVSSHAAVNCGRSACPYTG